MSSPLNFTIIYNFSTSTHAEDEDSYDASQSVYVNAKEWIWKIVPPIIVTLGSFGNGLIMVVLLRQIKTLSSTAIYLLSLAFSDLMILLLGPVRQWIMYMWYVDVRLLSDAGCKTSLYFTYFSFQLSSWLLVAVTIERVISVVLPHKVKFACTAVKAGSIVLINVVCLAAFNSHFFYGFGLESDISNMERNRQTECTPLYEDYAVFAYDILPWLDFAIVFGLPFIILLTGNLIIIASLKRRVQKHRRMGATNTTNEGHSLTMLLIMLCAVFFICLTPSHIFFILLPYLRAAAMELPKQEMLRRRDLLIFIHAIVSCFNYINSTSNFMLYCLSGSRFRTEVRHLLTCKHAGKGDVFGNGSPRKSSKYVKLRAHGTAKTTETDPNNDIHSTRERDDHNSIRDLSEGETNADRGCFVVQKSLDKHDVAATESYVTHL